MFWVLLLVCLVDSVLMFDCSCSAYLVVYLFVLFVFLFNSVGIVLILASLFGLLIMLVYFPDW